MASPGERALYFHHPACQEHDPCVVMPGHPDTPLRLLMIEDALEASDWLGWERREAPAALEGELQLVHSPAHVQRIRRICEEGGGAVDPDTAVGPPSFRAALHAAGAACEMARSLTLLQQAHTTHSRCRASSQASLKLGWASKRV